MIREAAVAGQFYPGRPAELRQTIKNMVDTGGEKREAAGVICPHAGYVYSGPVAAAVFSMLKFPSTFIVIGPNHRGMGKPFSLMKEGSWKTPLGETPINRELADQIQKESAYLEADHQAHRYEHSLEVQLPFMQYFKPDITIVPIVLSHADTSVYKDIGLSIARAEKKFGDDVVILASSDMTHYEPHEIAKSKDRQAIDAILNLDADELVKRIQKYDITMCGYAPVICLITAARELGAKKTELVKYQTSGETSGDYSSVVGYAGIIISK